MKLPIMASPADIEQVVGFLKKRVSSVAISDARATLNSKLMDQRKLNAYVTWGFVQRDGDKITITEHGIQLAGCSTAEEKQEIYKKLIKRIEPYAGIVEWLSYNKMQDTYVTHIEIAKQWHDTDKYQLSSEPDKALTDSAVCFFRICEAAGLGKFHLGRKGQPTRLQLNNTAVSSFFTKESVSAMPIEAQAKDASAQHNSSLGLTEEKESAYYEQPVVCENGQTALIRLPKDISEADEQLVYNIFKMFMESRFDLKQ